VHSANFNMNEERHPLRSVRVSGPRHSKLVGLGHRCCDEQGSATVCDFLYINFLILIAVLCFLAVRAMRRAPSNGDRRWGRLRGTFVGLPVAAIFASIIFSAVVRPWRRAVSPFASHSSDTVASSFSSEQSSNDETKRADERWTHMLGCGRC
jgi:hypothetical protein